MKEMTIEELVVMCGENLFPCAFIQERGTDIWAFDAKKARLHLRTDIPGGSRMVELLPERCLFEELVRNMRRQCRVWVGENALMVRVVDYLE
jgi:hypothetical protein